MPISSDRSVRIVLLFLEAKAEDQLAVAEQKKILSALPSEENSTSLSDFRFKLEELKESSIGKKCFRGYQAYVDLADEVVANVQIGVGLNSLLHSGSDFRRNIFQVRFHRRAELRDQDPKWQTSLGATARRSSAETQVRHALLEGEE